MAKKKTSEEKEKIKENEMAKAKILELMALKTAQKSLEEMIEKIKEFLRNYVEINALGLTPEKQYKFWEKDLCGVELQDNPQHETDIDGFINLVGIRQAVEFLIINRTAILEAISAKRLDITEKDLEKITKTTYGKKKVKPYYGLKQSTLSF
jgi:CRISPR/Cas system-associated protein endoribonuclease Cas2